MQLRSNTDRLKPVGLRLIKVAALCLTIVPAAALACTDKSAGVAMDAVFIEGAPIDRLLVTNRSDTGWKIEQITWDLMPSAGQVIFDTTGSGAGVEVFQPFRQLSAKDTRRAGGEVSDVGQGPVLAAEPVVTDGDQSLVIQFESFEPRQVFGMSIDVDDQIASRQITVERGEMQGATLQVVFVHEHNPRRTLIASFDDSARASSCESYIKSSE